MTPFHKLNRINVAAAVAFVLTAIPALAQVPDGPQSSPPPPAHHVDPVEVQKLPQTPDPLNVPAGTRFAVVLENGISTRGAKPGDSLYFRTSFPITQNNRVVIPIGCYLRGELVEAKRPGRIKGRRKFRMKLNTMIFPNGYTVDLNAARAAPTPAAAKPWIPKAKSPAAAEGQRRWHRRDHNRNRRWHRSDRRWREGRRHRSRYRWPRRARRNSAYARPRSRTPARLHARHRSRTRSNSRRQSNPLQQRRGILAHHSAASAQQLSACRCEKMTSAECARIAT